MKKKGKREVERKENVGNIFDVTEWSKGKVDIYKLERKDIGRRKGKGEGNEERENKKLNTKELYGLVGD